jgi:hypothetical protein
MFVNMVPRTCGPAGWRGIQKGLKKTAYKKLHNRVKAENNATNSVNHSFQLHIRNKVKLSL